MCSPSSQEAYAEAGVLLKTASGENGNTRKCHKVKDPSHLLVRSWRIRHTAQIPDGQGHPLAPFAAPPNRDCSAIVGPFLQTNSQANGRGQLTNCANRAPSGCDLAFSSLASGSRKKALGCLGFAARATTQNPKPNTLSSIFTSTSNFKKTIQADTGRQLLMTAPPQALSPTVVSLLLCRSLSLSLSVSRFPALVLRSLCSTSSAVNRVPIQKLQKLTTSELCEFPFRSCLACGVLANEITTLQLPNPSGLCVFGLQRVAQIPTPARRAGMPHNIHLRNCGICGFALWC